MSYIKPYGYSNYRYYRPYMGKNQLEPKDNKYIMDLRGEGRIQATPDVAVISLGVITEDKDIISASEENARRMNKVISKLKDMGIKEKDIRTQNYNINKDYDYIDGKEVFRAYRVTNNLDVTIKAFDEIGDIIDSAIDNGANTVNNIRFELSNPSIYYRKALELAIKDAIIKAKDMERVLKVKVNEIPIHIIEEGSGIAPMEERVVLAYTEKTTPIESGHIEINAKIKARFNYRELP